MHIFVSLIKHYRIMCTGHEEENLKDLLAEELLKEKSRDIIIRGNEKFIKNINKKLNYHAKKYAMEIDSYNEK